MMRIFLLLLLSVGLLSACSHQSLEKKVELVQGYSAYQYKDIYFSSQPKLETLQSLKDAGFATIINLRQKTEEEYKESDEEKIALQVKLNYVNIPTNGKEPLTDAHIDKITQAIIKTRKQGKTLIHCSSGNRVALWAGAHFFKDHKYSKEQAIKKAKSIGLTNETLLTNLESFLKSK